MPKKVIAFELESLPVRIFYALLLLFLLNWLSCQQAESSHSQFVQEIEQKRVAKDRFFKISRNSPIPDEVKTEFDGLSYFPVDPHYRLELPLIEYEHKTRTKIATSSGVERDAEKYGYFHFEMAGKICTLQVYKLSDIQDQHPNHLFVPFCDATSGRETYGGGRYLDLHAATSGIYRLDFNLAYNPSCAYGKSGYNCPIPPEENRLDVAIRAGEKYDPQLYHSNAVPEADR